MQHIAGVSAGAPSHRGSRPGLSRSELPLALLPTKFESAVHTFKGYITNIRAYNPETKLLSFELNAAFPQKETDPIVRVELKGEWARQLQLDPKTNMGYRIQLLGQGGKLERLKTKDGCKIVFSKGCSGKLYDIANTSREFDLQMTSLKLAAPVTKPAAKSAVFSLNDPDDDDDENDDATTAPASSVLATKAPERPLEPVNRGFQDEVDEPTQRSQKRKASTQESELDEPDEVPVHVEKKGQRAMQTENKRAKAAATKLANSPEGWPVGLNFPLVNKVNNYRTLGTLAKIRTRDSNIVAPLFSLICLAYAKGDIAQAQRGNRDWHRTIVLRDLENPTGSEEVNVFATQEAYLPHFKDGDLIILQDLKPSKTQNKRDNSVGYANRFRFQVYTPTALATLNITQLQGLAHTQLPAYSLAIVTSAELEYAKEFVLAMKQAAPVPFVESQASSFRVNSAPRRSKPLLCISEVEERQFCKLVVEIVKIYNPQLHSDSSALEVYVTDYTSHPDLFNYEIGHAEHHGPLGQYVLCIAIWPPHSNKVKEWKVGTKLYLVNVQIDTSPLGVLEGKVRQDRERPNQIDVFEVNHEKPRSWHEIPTDVRAAYSKLDQARIELQKSRLADDEQIVAEEPSAPPRPLSPPKASTTKVATPMPVAPKRPAESKGTPVTETGSVAVACDYRHMTYSTIAEALDDTELNARYHLRGRIVDHWPCQLQRFVLATCGECCAEITHMQTKCLEDGHDEVDYAYFFLVDIEEIAEGRPDSHEGPLRRIRVVIDTPDVMCNLAPSAGMLCHDDGNRDFAALASLIRPALGNIKYDKYEAVTGRGPILDFAVLATTNEGSTRRSFRFEGTRLTGVRG